MDWQKRWIDYLDVKGYLRHFIEGIVRSDEILHTLTVSAPISIKPLYIYESKMVSKFKFDCYSNDNLLKKARNIISVRPFSHVFPLMIMAPKQSYALD